ncbi:MAG TPA: hypothetical protein VGD48_26730 [Kutzneria sp.]|jgi:hypothetical protein
MAGNRFGPLDPFCFLAVVPLVIVAVVLVISDLLLFAFIPLVLAGLIMLGDSWANRRPS